MLVCDHCGREDSGHTPSLFKVTTICCERLGGLLPALHGGTTLDLCRPCTDRLKRKVADALKRPPTTAEQLK